MDIKVDVDNVLRGDHQSLENAAIWLREHLNIPEQCTVFDDFEEYFNCRIEVDDRFDCWMEPNRVVFESSTDLTAFLLKWS